METIKNGNGDLERKVENILINKAQIIYGLIVIMVPIIGFFFKIQLDIALIKQNHEAHMQAALESIAELKKEQGNLMIQLNTDHDAIIRLLQMHNQ